MQSITAAEQNDRANQQQIEAFQAYERALEIHKLSLMNRTLTMTYAALDHQADD